MQTKVGKPAIKKVIQHHLVAIMVKASQGGINSRMLVIQNAMLHKQTNEQTNKQTNKQTKTNNNNNNNNNKKQ